MKHRSFVVFGLGHFGATVATELARLGNHVLGICTDEFNVNRMADELSEVVRADFRDEDALRAAGVGDHDVAIVAISNDLEASILCTMNAKLLGVETIWAKATSKAHHRILSRLDVDRVLLPEQEMGQHIAQMLNFPTMRDYVSLGNGFHIVDMTVPPVMEGSTTEDSKLITRHNLTALAVMRGGEILCSGAGPVPLQSGDKLILIGRRNDLREFGQVLGRGR